MALGEMIELAESAGQINTADNLTLFAAFQKCFVVNGAKLYVADFINKKLTTADMPHLKTPDLATSTIPEHGDVLTGAGGGQMIVDYIDAMADAAHIYGYQTSIADFNNGEAVTYYPSNDSTKAQQTLHLSDVPISGPLWYAWTPYAFIGSPIDGIGAYPYGKLPPKAYLGCLYQGRCVLAGDPNTPHGWYMSRAGNPWDWAFLTTDALSPVAGANGVAGVVGDIITALVPYQDDYLVFGGSHTITVARGDPASGGSINCINETTGMFGGTSWCRDNNGNFYFLGNNGICQIPVNLGAATNLTQDKLPNLVRDLQLDSAVHRVTMVYDREQYGIVIAKTTLSTGANSNYWYDLRTGGFFPETYSDNCGIYSGCFYDSIAVSYRRMVVGCTDGFIRFFDTTCKGDVDTADDISTPSVAINSYVTVGPMKIGSYMRTKTKVGQSDDDYGKLESLTYISGGDVNAEASQSGPVDYKVFVDTNAEGVISQIKQATTPLISGTFTTGQGRKPRIRTRARGTYLAVKVGNSTANQTFSVEKIVGEIKPGGKVQARA